MISRAVKFKFITIVSHLRLCQFVSHSLFKLANIVGVNETGSRPVTFLTALASVHSASCLDFGRSITHSLSYREKERMNFVLATFPGHHRSIH